MVCPVGKITFKTSPKMLFKVTILPKAFVKPLLIASVVSVLTYFLIFNTPLIVSNCTEFKLSLIVGTCKTSPVSALVSVLLYCVINPSPNSLVFITPSRNLRRLRLKSKSPFSLLIKSASNLTSLINDVTCICRLPVVPPKLVFGILIISPTLKYISPSSFTSLIDAFNSEFTTLT